MIEQPILDFLTRAGLVAPGDVPQFDRLSGGVSSDIWVVRAASRTFCLKRALPQLRVAAEWRADVARNATEVLWLTKVAQLNADVVPKVLASDPGLAVFALEYLPPGEYEPWKSRLARGVASRETAASVGRHLAHIHLAFAEMPGAALEFDTTESFYALRLEPYLVATARVHSDVAASLEELARRTARTKKSVVHGDVSPKNILIGRRGPVFLDAECAWFGDPAFDLAFCLNHLLLKTLWVPSAEADLLEVFDVLATSYLRGVKWEPPDALEQRAASLLPGLLLARIDGKSPVEYLTDERSKETVRRIAKPLLKEAPADLKAVRRAWAERDANVLRGPGVAQSPRIDRVLGRRVWDSRGRPTVEAEIVLSSGAVGRAIAPAGASTGHNEALELRDGGAVFGGLGVDRAVHNVSTDIAAALRGFPIHDQAAIDRRLIDLDGTPNKARLGANALVAVSMAVAHAAAAARGVALWRHIADGREVSLPMPMIQIFGGGAHAGQRVDIQDFLIVPIGASTFAEAISMAAQIYHSAGSVMSGRGRLRGVADEGGWWPEFDSNREALDALVLAIQRARLRPGVDAAIAIDVAASQLRKGSLYHLAADDRAVSSDELVELLLLWCRDYPIISIEDPLAEDDHDGMRLFTSRAGAHLQIVGDDYLVTSSDRIAAAAAAGACNAVLLKPNQIGTVTETAAALATARDAGWGTIVSARSGETEDVTIVHLAVGWAAGQLKVGSCARSERTAKWNEALRIEEALGDAATLDRLPVRTALWINTHA
jgi:enolase